MQQHLSQAQPACSFPRHLGTGVLLPLRGQHKRSQRLLRLAAAGSKRDGSTPTVTAQQQAQPDGDRLEAQSSGSSKRRERRAAGMPGTVGGVVEEVIAILDLAVKGVQMQLQLLKADVWTGRKDIAGAVDEMVLSFTTVLTATRKAARSSLGPDAAEQLAEASSDAQGFAETLKREAAAGKDADLVLDELLDRLTAIGLDLQEQLLLAARQAAGRTADAEANAAAGGSVPNFATGAAALASVAAMLSPRGTGVQGAANGAPKQSASIAAGGAFGAQADVVAEAFGILEDAVSSLAGDAADLKRDARVTGREAVQALLDEFDARTSLLKSPQLAAPGSSYLADSVEVAVERLRKRGRQLQLDADAKNLKPNDAIDEIMEDIRFAASDLRRAVLAKRRGSRRVKLGANDSLSSVDSSGSYDEDAGAAAAGFAAAATGAGVSNGAATSAAEGSKPAPYVRNSAISSTSGSDSSNGSSSNSGVQTAAVNIEDQAWAAAAANLEEQTWALASLAAMKTGRSSRTSSQRQQPTTTTASAPPAAASSSPATKPSGKQPRAGGADAMAGMLRNFLPMFGMKVKAKKARTAAGQDVDDIRQEALVLADDALAAFRAKAKGVARAMVGPDADVVAGALAAFEARAAAIKAAVAEGREGAVADLDGLMGSLTASLQDLDLLLAQELEMANQTINNAMSKMEDTSKLSTPLRRSPSPKTFESSTPSSSSSSSLRAASPQAPPVQSTAPSLPPLQARFTPSPAATAPAAAASISQAATSETPEVATAAELEVAIAAELEVVTATEVAQEEALELAGSSLAAMENVLTGAQAAAVSATGQAEAGTAAAAVMLEEVAEHIVEGPMVVSDGSVSVAYVTGSGAQAGADAAAAAVQQLRATAASDAVVYQEAAPSDPLQPQQNATRLLQLAAGLAATYLLNETVAFGLAVAELHLPSTLVATLPAALASMLAVAGGLTVIGESRAQGVVDFFAPSTAFTTKWLPVFCVPVLASLPQAVEGMPGGQLISMAGVLAVGVVATMTATAKAVRDGSSAATSAQQQPPQQPAALKPALFWGAVAAVSLSLTAVLPSYGPLLTLPAGLGCTVCGYLLAAALPGALQLLVHPTALGAVFAVAGAALHGSLMGVGQQAGLEMFLDGAAIGPANILISLLCVGVTNIGFHIHSSRRALAAAGGMGAIAAASLASAVFSIGCTVAAARLLQLPSVWSLALLPRSLTTPAAMSIGAAVAAPAICTTAVLVMQAVLATALGRAVLAAMGARSAAQRGVVAGATAGVVGVAALTSGDQEQMAFAGLSCVLVGAFVTAFMAVPASRAAILSLISVP